LLLSRKLITFVAERKEKSKSTVGSRITRLFSFGFLGLYKRQFNKDCLLFLCRRRETNKNSATIQQSEEFPFFALEMSEGLAFASSETHFARETNPEAGI
jgi:hypothetical protein